MKIIGVSPNVEDFFSISKTMQTAPYQKINDNPTMVATFDFQLSHDLRKSTVVVTDTLEVFALTGGCFIFLFCVFSFLFGLGVEWLMNLEIIKTLFRVEPSLGKKTKSAEKMNS